MDPLGLEQDTWLCAEDVKLTLLPHSWKDSDALRYQAHASFKLPATQVPLSFVSMNDGDGCAGTFRVSQTAEPGTEAIVDITASYLEPGGTKDMRACYLHNRKGDVGGVRRLGIYVSLLLSRIEHRSPQSLPRRLQNRRLAAGLITVIMSLCAWRFIFDFLAHSQGLMCRLQFKSCIPTYHYMIITLIRRRPYIFASLISPQHWHRSILRYVELVLDISSSVLIRCMLTHEVFTIVRVGRQYHITNHLWRHQREVQCLIRTACSHRRRSGQDRHDLT